MLRGQEGLYTVNSHYPGTMDHLSWELWTLFFSGAYVSTVGVFEFLDWWRGDMMNEAVVLNRGEPGRTHRAAHVQSSLSGTGEHRSSLWCGRGLWCGRCSWCEETWKEYVPATRTGHRYIHRDCKVGVSKNLGFR